MKAKKYGGIARLNHCDFKALVVDSHGGLSSHALQVVKLLAKKHSVATGLSRSDSTEHLLNSISIALHKGNARMNIDVARWTERDEPSHYSSTPASSLPPSSSHSHDDAAFYDDTDTDSNSESELESELYVPHSSSSYSSEEEHDNIDAPCPIVISSPSTAVVCCTDPSTALSPPLSTPVSPSTPVHMLISAPHDQSSPHGQVNDRHVTVTPVHTPFISGQVVHKLPHVRRHEPIMIEEVGMESDDD